jgi:hypothetical protein
VNAACSCVDISGATQEMTSYVCRCLFRFIIMCVLSNDLLVYYKLK